MTRIFHSCDFHGNESVWRKALRTGTYYKADVVMVCGDLTGKAIVPIVRRKTDEWFWSARGRGGKLHSKKEVERAKNEIRNMGYYPYETTPEEVEDLKSHPEKVNALFIKLMRETLQRWIRMAEEIVPENVKIIVNPGNDDVFEIDDIIEKSERVIYPLGRVVQLDDTYPLISCEWVNPTPWKTPRECSEKELMKKLEKEFNRVDSYENLICNFHAPPYDTPIDLAPKLDKQLRVVMRGGAPVMEHVGSKAVREAIERYQPFICLHGHIHESAGYVRIGRTLCVNPGSEYTQGILRGYVIDLPSKPSEKMNFWRVEV